MGEALSAEPEREREGERSNPNSTNEFITKQLPFLQPAVVELKEAIENLKVSQFNQTVGQRYTFMQ